MTEHRPARKVFNNLLDGAVAELFLGPTQRMRDETNGFRRTLKGTVPQHGSADTALQLISHLAASKLRTLQGWWRGVRATRTENVSDSLDTANTEVGQDGLPSTGIATLARPHAQGFERSVGHNS